MKFEDLSVPQLGRSQSKVYGTQIFLANKIAYRHSRQCHDLVEEQTVKNDHRRRGKHMSLSLSMSVPASLASDRNLEAEFIGIVLQLQNSWAAAIAAGILN